MLKIHFLNVGHGDCTIIEHPDGLLSIIDINNGIELDLESAEELAKSFNLPISALLARVRKDPLHYANTLGYANTRDITGKLERWALDDLIRKGYDIELTNPVDFLHNHYPTKDIHRYIQTHPDLDHMRGITALTQARTILNFWDTTHSKIPDFQSDADKEDWATYDQLRSSDATPKVLKLNRGHTGAYWNQNPVGIAGGHGIEILAPTPAIIDAANQEDKTNNLSYVLQLTYKGRKVIFGGDAEEDVWAELVQEYGDGLKCDILKASHHGRDSGYYAPAVALMRPQYTIVSVGKKPDTDASNKYAYYSDNVWSTRWRGNITLTIDDHGKATIISEYDR